MLKNTRKNNFTLIRLILAVFIMLTHSHDLWADTALDFIIRIFKARPAVDAFFVISGFFIFTSCEKSNSLKNFFIKRVLRIYPAYVTCLALVILVCAAITKGQVFQFPLGVVKYFLANLLALNFFQPTLPPLFEGNPHPAVNSSLWVLKVEFMFYASVPLILYWMKKWNRFSVLLTLYVISYLYFINLHNLFLETGSGVYFTLARQFPGKLMFFVSGAIMAYYLKPFQKNALIYFVLALTGLFFWYHYNIRILYPISLAVVLTFLGSGIIFLGEVRKVADFSVGIFLYHCPVMQVLVWSGYFKGNALQGFVLGCGVTLLLAYLSWHLIEKRFLGPGVFSKVKTG